MSEDALELADQSWQDSDSACQSSELLLTAWEIALQELGSWSGGELRHRSIGAISSMGKSVDVAVLKGTDGSELKDACGGIATVVSLGLQGWRRRAFVYQDAT